VVVLFVRFNTGSSDLAFVGGPFRTICFYVVAIDNFSINPWII
jgi:hypothetical protein